MLVLDYGSYIIFLDSVDVSPAILGEFYSLVGEPIEDDKNIFQSKIVIMGIEYDNDQPVVSQVTNQAECDTIMKHLFETGII